MNKELITVAEWYTLGIHLGLQKHELDIIRKNFDREGVLQCRLEMLTLWYDNHPDVTWSDLVKALDSTGQKRLAHKLALKYSKFLCYFLLVEKMSAYEMHENITDTRSSKSGSIV